LADFHPVVVKYRNCVSLKGSSNCAYSHTKQNYHKTLTILIACCRQKKYKCDSDSKGENDSQNLYQPGDKLYEKCIKNMDAYLEEELYDILTYCIQSAHAADFEKKKTKSVYNW
jgi:hypothetical protein